MGFFAQLILYVGFTLLSGALRPRPRPSGPEPGGLGDFDVPTAEEGRAIPVVFGTVDLRSPNVVWYGDLSVVPRTTNQGGQEVTTGHHYFLGVQYVLCHGPVDDIVQVRWEDKEPSSVVTDFGTFKRFDVFGYTLFGGDEGGGGVTGWLDVHKGSSSQNADPYLEAVLGVSLPGYRGVCHAVSRHMYVGTSPYLKPVAFVVRRLPNQLGLTGGAHDIAGDANPAAMIFEILTDPLWGLGLSSALIDVASFQAAGQTLATEGLGLSMVFDSAGTAGDFIDEICRHVDAIVVTDPTTGFLRLRLVRAGYSVSSLPLLDESNVLECSMSRPGWGSRRNVVRVRYTERTPELRFAERIAQAMDLASIQVRNGEMTSEEVAFRGFSTALNAQRAAARELMAESYPFAGFQLTVNRAGWALGPGDVVRLTWPKYALADLPCRITRIHPGHLRDGRIRIDLAEDIFSVAWTAYTPPGPSGWVDPSGPPTLLAAQRLLEAPYALAPLRRVVTLGVRGSAVALGYEVWSSPYGGTVLGKSNVVNAMTPSGVLDVGISATATALVADVVVDAEALASISAVELAEGRNILLVDEELIAWQTVTDNGDGTHTLSGLVRGVMDSTPTPHSAAARVWFLSNGFGYTTPAAYGVDGNVKVKLLPYNNAGVVTLAAATEMNLVTTSRASKPYVPTGIRENGILHPVHIADALAVTWSHRDRLGTWQYDDAGVTASPEAGATTRVKVYGEGGGLIHTESGLTGTSWTYPVATEISESGGLGRPNATLRTVVEAVNGSLVSHQAHDHTCHRAGWGLRWGQYWGGLPG